MSGLLPSYLVTFATHLLAAGAAFALIYVGRRQVGLAFRSVIGGDADKSARGELAMLGLCAGAAAFLVATLVGLNPWVALAGSVLGAVATPRIVARKRLVRFREAFDGNLAEALGTIASSLRAGLTLKDSLIVASNNSPQPFAGEMQRAMKQYRFGRPLDETLDDIRRRVATPSANIAFGAMIIGNQLGGNVPETLKRIVVTIRERQRVEGRLKALTAQGRAQAVLLCAAPVFIGVAMYVYDPVKMGYLTQTLAGQALLTLAIVLEIIGIVVTRRVMTLEI